MNFNVSKLVICILLFVLAGLLTGCKDQNPVFQINDVVSDPGAYSKPLTLEGIVYAYSQSDSSIVGVMDVKELQCTTPNCKKALLAVKVSGTSLAIGDQIEATGSIEKESWGYILKANEIKVTAKHKLGA